MHSVGIAPGLKTVENGNACDAMTLDYRSAGIFIWGLKHALGEVSRNLKELNATGLLMGDAASLAQIGYERNLGLAADQTFTSLMAQPLHYALARAGAKPRALLFQHALVANASVPYKASQPDAATRRGYFAPALMNEIGLDDLPYFCSVASGCAGFAFLLSNAGGLFLASSRSDPAVCAMGDRRPKAAPFDLYRERILRSDHASGFVIGKERRGYQVLGLNFHSTARTGLPLMELVKRTVQMVNSLAQELKVDLRRPNTLAHFPNIFPQAWKMVIRSLQMQDDQGVMIDLAERAHCGGSDSVISLEKSHRGEDGRLHLVMAYGTGLHIAVCILEEKAEAV